MRRFVRAHSALTFIALCCCLIFAAPDRASADELTRMANTSFALTILDMATTRLSLAHTNGAETNPVARPFVRSDAGALGYALLTSAVERIVFRKKPRAFIAVDAVEAYAVVHNYTSRLRALAATHTAEIADPTVQR